MKRINQKIKNLLQVEINQQFLKIILVLIVYLVLFSIFKAGYEYQSIFKIKNKPTETKLQEFKYYVTYKGKQKQYNSTNPRDLFSLLDAVDNLTIDYTEYYEGKEIVSLDNNRNFKIIVNGEKVNNFISNKLPNLETRTKVEIIN